MSQKMTSTFPYTRIPGAPYTDGIVEGDNLGTSVFLPTPGDVTEPIIPYENRGRLSDEPYMGNTDSVDTNTTAHNVFAGNF